MGSPVNKVFLEVGRRPVIEWSLGLFERCAEVDRVVVVANQADLGRCESLASRFPKVFRVVAGGDVRHRSEFAGLAVLSAAIDAAEIEVVLVHDAVRPFSTPELVSRLLGGTDGVQGCIPGLPLPPATVLRDGDLVTGFPANLFAVQTPQAADATWLLEAHNKAARAGFLGTDTASVIEWVGGAVAVVPGEAENIKLTAPADLMLAEEIARRRLEFAD
jgi:2-C-methyl-D-erythritol 4-phosphate cytidylyltransferase